MINNDSWNMYYKLAKAYYDHHGNLNIVVDFQEKIGIFKRLNRKSISVIDFFKYFF